MHARIGSGSRTGRPQRQPGSVRKVLALALVLALGPQLAVAQSFSLSAEPFSLDACVGANLDIRVRLFTLDGYAFPVKVSYPSLPLNFFFLFAAPNPVVPNPNGAVVNTRVTAGPSTLGPQTLEIRGIGADQQVRSTFVGLNLEDIPGAPGTRLPEANASTGTQPLLQWNGSAEAKAFQVQVGIDPDFDQDTDVVFEAFVPQRDIDALVPDVPLPANQVLYWRVRGINHCGDGYWSPVSQFVTNGTCIDLGAPIPDGGELVRDLQLASTGLLSDLDVQVRSDHGRVGDLAIDLSHGARSVRLLAPGSCAAPGISAQFDDGAELASGNACGNGTAIQGGVQPSQALAAFNGEPAQGNWRISVRDQVVNGQAGTLQQVCLQPRTTAVVEAIFANGME